MVPLEFSWSVPMVAATPLTPSLARFVPIEILKQLADGDRGELSPRNDSFPGTVLFADISGFTSLSERLGKRGSEGVEELTQTLNDYFGDLIETVISSGGDIVKFAGDALLAVWRAEEDDIAASVVGAAGCALAAQEKLRGRTTKDGDSLSLRMGIGTGVIVTASVGGTFDRWEFVVSGKPVLEATNAADAADLGEVVLGPNAVKRIGTPFKGQPGSGGQWRLDGLDSAPRPAPRETPELNSASSRNLLGYVPAAIHQRLNVGHSNWLGELRRLTVLFVSLPQMNHATPLTVAQEVMERLQAALYRYEGSVNKLSADDKGITFVAAMGLPPLAHEDDEARGVRAAVDIKSALEEIGQPCSIGVTSGRVFCGIIGNIQRCEYTMIGDVVNLSARLMQAADGGILCDRATYQAANRQLDFEPLPPIAVKGKTGPVAVYHPCRKRNSAERRPLAPMIGRQKEQRRLAELQDRLTGELRGAIVVVDGEPGIGKSRLVAALRDGAAAKGIQSLLGSALDIERSTPYFAWRGVFRSLFRLEGTELDSLDSLDSLEAHELAERLERGLEGRGEPAEFAPLLNPVLAGDMPDNAFTSQLTQEARVNMTNDLLKRLLKVEAGRNPCQIVLEDCHWMDSASWSLMRLLAEAADDFLLFIITRPLHEKPPAEYLRIIERHVVTQISLKPLSESDVESLVCRNLGANELPRQVADLIREKSQGNPLFGEELAFALRDAGIIKVEAGRCLLASETDLVRLGFPDTVQGVVTSRIDRLVPSEQLTLKVASVIGRAFSCRILQDLFPVERDRALQRIQLQSLSRRDLIVASEIDEELDYQFRHVITQEVAYDLIPPTQRQDLHRAIAQWYEEHHGDDLSPFYALLAKHWSRTERAEKAIEYLEKSGESAARQFANSEVIQFFTQALKLAETSEELATPERRAHWNRQVAEACYNLGDLDSSLKHFGSALEDLELPFAKSNVGTLGRALIELGKQFGLKRLAQMLRRRTAKSRDQLHEAAQCYERLAQIYYLNNARLHTIHAVFRALNLAETVGTSAVLARCYANAAVVAGLLLMHRKARFYAARAIEVAADIDEPDCTSYVGMILGIYWVTVGEWETAEDLLQNAVEIAEKIRARRRWAESAFTLVIGLWRRGNIKRCAVLARLGKDAGQRDRVPQVELWGASWWLRCALVQTDDKKEHSRLAEELQTCLRHSELSPADQILGHGMLAAAYWRLGEKAAAFEEAETVSRVIAETNQICHYVLPAYSALFEVYSGLLAEEALGNRGSLKKRLTAIRKSLREFGLMYPIGRAIYFWHEGQYQERHGSRRRAIRHWQKAVKLAKRFRMPFAEALVHWDLAQSALPEHQRAEHWMLAEILFQTAGANHFLNRMRSAK